jgi:hypothetical protein
MLTPAEFKKRWDKKSHPLVKIPQRVLNDLNVPEKAKRFLAEAGVPEEEYLGYPVNVNLPRLPNAFPVTKHLPASFERYRAFGEVGYERYACIDEMEQGRIVYVSVRDVEPEVIFVNSSIQQLLECWLVSIKYADLYQTREVWPNDTLRRRYADLWEEEVRRIDPAVFTEEFSDWPYWIRRVREGLPL